MNLLQAVFVLVPAARIGANVDPTCCTLTADGTAIAAWNPAFGTQPTAQALAAVTPAQVTAAQQAAWRAVAQTLLASDDPYAVFIRALALAALDAINVVRAGQALAPITQAALLNAVLSKITSGAAD